MGSTSHLLRVFVACPNDVDAERQAVSNLIDELNSIWGAELGVRFEMLHWSTHVVPGISADAQTLINEQIGDDYEVFIAIFWSRFGTPTPRAGSGTEEEFDRSLTRFRKDPTAVHLMVYFKNEPLPPAQIVAAELTKIEGFRRKVAASGGLYANFGSTANFTSLLRMHLSRFMQTWLKRQRPEDTSATLRIRASAERQRDQAVVALIASFERHMQRFAQIGARVQRATEKFTEHLGAQVSTAQALKQRGEWTKVAMGRQADEWAGQIDQFAADLEANATDLIAEFRLGFSDIARAATLFHGLGSFATRAFEGARGTVQRNKIEVEETSNLIQLFRAIVDVTPPVTLSLTDAKTRLANRLGSFALALETTVEHLREIEKIVISSERPAASG